MGEAFDKVAVLLEYQLELRTFCDPIDAENFIGRLEIGILRNIRKGISDRNLKRSTNAYRFGLDLYAKALGNLTKGGLLVTSSKKTKSGSSLWYDLTASGRDAAHDVGGIV